MIIFLSIESCLMVIYMYVFYVHMCIYMCVYLFYRKYPFCRRLQFHIVTLTASSLSFPPVITFCSKPSTSEKQAERIKSWKVSKASMFKVKGRTPAVCWVMFSSGVLWFVSYSEH